LPNPFTHVWLFTLLPLVAWLAPALRDNLLVLKWLRTGSYVSRNPEKQKELFGRVPKIDDSVARYCRDQGLFNTTLP
jgi:hypothetical protein